MSYSATIARGLTSELSGSAANSGRLSRASRSRAAPPPRTVVCRADKENGTPLAAKVAKAIQHGVVAAAAAATVAMPATFMLPEQAMPQAEAVGQKTNLPNGDPTKNAKALLRDSLPIKNKPIRAVQKELESIAEALRIPGSKSLGPVARSVRKSEEILKSKKADIVNAFAPAKTDEGLVALVNLSSALAEFDTVLANQDKQEVPIIQQKCLDAVGAVEEAMVDGFPYAVPEKYANLPQLKGRATVQMDLKFNKAKDNLPGGTIIIVLDGYSAPVTAGNFLDLVNRGFYNGMEIQRADGFVVQTGDPDGPAVGFVDPKTKETRTIPFEVLVDGDTDPTYEDTLEDLGRFQDLPILPFNAFGTLAMARSENDPNSGSSQIFFLLKESELTPSGANLLDGRYAVFGYIIEGQDLLTDCNLGDKITSAKVLKGGENLVVPDNGPSLQPVAEEAPPAEEAAQ